MLVAAGDNQAKSWRQWDWLTQKILPMIDAQVCRRTKEFLGGQFRAIIEHSDLEIDFLGERRHRARDMARTGNPKMFPRSDRLPIKSVSVCRVLRHAYGIVETHLPGYSAFSLRQHAP